MPYSAEISRSNPTCFLFLIDQSGSMADAVPNQANRRKADAVADAINRLLQNLVIRCAKEEGVRDYFYAGLIGFLFPKAKSSNSTRRTNLCRQKPNENWHTDCPLLPSYLAPPSSKIS
jgi:hypothetical protein